MGFKVWVVAGMSGYTIVFNIYTGKSEQYSDYCPFARCVSETSGPF